MNRRAGCPRARMNCFYFRLFLSKKKAMMTFSYLANELEGPNVEFAEGKVYYMSR